MSKQIAASKEVESFLNRYQQDEALQREYLNNPSRFFAETVPQREYALEVQAVESRLSSQSQTALNKAALRPELTAGMHSNSVSAELPLPGGAKITFEPTFGWFSVVTGYYLVLNEKATQDITLSLAAAGALTGLAPAVRIVVASDF